MAETYVGLHPFAYDNEYYLYTEKEEAEKEKFVSFMTQRNAQYKEPAEEIYNNKKLEEDELIWESFRDNIEPPTPQIKQVDGFDSEEEIKNNSDDGGCDGDDNPDDTNPDDNPDDNNNG